MQNVDTTDLSRLQNVVRRHREISGKSFGEIWSHEGRQWSFELYAACKELSPTPDRIINDAKNRGFKIKRTSKFPGLMGQKNVSRAAEIGALNKLEGRKSDLFEVVADANGVRVKRVRFSEQKDGTYRRLIGGRYGNKFSKKAVRADDITTNSEYWEGEEGNNAIAEARKNPNVKRLNKTALQNAIELGLRSRAAKGGTMAVQWLPQVFKKRKSSVKKSGGFIVRSTKGIPLGMVEFRNMESGENPQVQLSAFVPGTGKQITSRGIINKVQGRRIADRLQYINRKMEEAKTAALRNN